MCQLHSIPVFNLQSNYGDQDILYYELYFNQIMFAMVQAWDIDQINWKGKDDNTSLYQLANV